MKIRNLLLGSLAVAGLSTTGAYAADLGVLTSLDVCDNLGLSGLTISSDTNCLQLSGEVRYRFTWGDYTDPSFLVHTGAGDWTAIGGDGEADWESRFDAWLKAVATADTDFGPAKAVIKLKQVQQRVSNDNLVTVSSGELVTVFDGVNIAGVGGDDTDGVIMDEAYVSIGDTTVIMAGKKGSIMNKGDDAPLNFLGLFNSEKVDVGVSWGPLDSGAADGLPDGGHVIQVVSDLGNGLSVGAGLEKLDGDNLGGGAGTAVGVLSYAGEGISAHITGAAGGVLDGEVEAWGVHAGFAGTFDNFKVVLAGAFGHLEAYDTPALDPLTGLPTAIAGGDHWNVLASASATFDMFTIAGSVEAVNSDFTTGGETDIGAGASIGLGVTDTVTLNLGARWYREEANDVDNLQVAAQVVAAVTETLKLTGEIGWLSNDRTAADPAPTAPGPFSPSGDVFYGSAKVDWAPGGGYTASLKGTVTSGNDEFGVDPGYKIETDFKKTFE